MPTFRLEQAAPDYAVQSLREPGSWGREYFGNLEEVECPLLETATKERLVKTVTDWEHRSDRDNSLLSL
jgi:hypothetical protein